MSWLYVMWYATVEIMPHRNTSLLCWEEWCTETSEQILMGQALLWQVLNFPSVDLSPGFKPVSDSEVEQNGLKMMCWWYRFDFKSHFCKGWPWPLRTGAHHVHHPPWLSSFALLRLSRDQISEGNRAQSMRKEWKGGQASSVKPRCHLMPGMLHDGVQNHLTYCLACPETNPWEVENVSPDMSFLHILQHVITASLIKFSLLDGFCDLHVA